MCFGLARGSPPPPRVLSCTSHVARLTQELLCSSAVRFAKEELSRGDAVSPKEAAVVVVDVALGPTTEFPTGSFYRDGKQIGW